MLELKVEHKSDGSADLRIILNDESYYIAGEWDKNIGEAINSFCITLMETTGIDLHYKNFLIQHIHEYDVN